MSGWITNPPKPVPPEVAEARRKVAVELAREVKVTVKATLVAAVVPSRYVKMLGRVWADRELMDAELDRQVPGAVFTDELGRHGQQTKQRIYLLPEGDPGQQQIEAAA
jgi:hypothetical protein